MSISTLRNKPTCQYFKMVHQLSLVATIPHNNYIQTVSTLQALTGLTSPQNISTYTLISKPINKFKPKFEPGKVNQIEQYFMKCMTTWDDLKDFDLKEPIIDKQKIPEKNHEKFKTDLQAEQLFDNDTTESVDKPWTLHIADIPLAGKNQTCCSQTIYESTLVHNHTSMERLKKSIEKSSKEDEMNELINLSELDDLDKKDSFLQFLNDLGYDIINQYWVKGIRFFHGDIVIEIFKVFIKDETRMSLEKNKSIPIRLLDRSNSFQIKAFINIPKSTDIELINKGSKELLKLQDFLKNLVKLEIPDRIFMDSRVPNN